jgi:hypothetical protein
VENGKCRLNSGETFEELRTFVYGERGQIGGLSGKKDDHLMGLSRANASAQQSGVGDNIFL